jgi:hypothetical protein
VPFPATDTAIFGFFGAFWLYGAVFSHCHCHFWVFWRFFGYMGRFLATATAIFGFFGVFLAIWGHLWPFLATATAILSHLGTF